jgi:hypothetical protein
MMDMPLLIPHAVIVLNEQYWGVSRLISIERA